MAAITVAAAAIIEGGSLHWSKCVRYWSNIAVTTLLFVNENNGWGVAKAPQAPWFGGAAPVVVLVHDVSNC